MPNENKRYQEILPGEKLQFWQIHIAAWERSGISQKTYCNNKGLSWRCFCYWKKKVCGKRPLTFLPVTIKSVFPPASQSGASLKLLTRSGYGIEIGDGFNPQTLKMLLETLPGGV